MTATQTPGRGESVSVVDSQQPRPGTTDWRRPRSDAGHTRPGRPVTGRTLWQLHPDHIGLLTALEAARTTALVELDRRVQAEAEADELRRALTRAGAGLDRLAILHPAARGHIDQLIQAIWPERQEA